jgi:hypothetical protein
MQRIAEHNVILGGLILSYRGIGSSLVYRGQWAE